MTGQSSMYRGGEVISQQGWSREQVLLAATRSVIGAQVLLLAVRACTDTPTTLELDQVSAGLSHLVLGHFDICPVNPPLIRTLAAAPLYFCGLEMDWSAAANGAYERPERELSKQLLRLNGTRALDLIVVGRCVCLPIMCGGALACAAWARALYGGAAGLLAAVLWCTCPYLLAHGAFVTTDGHAAALLVIAGYHLWLWSRHPGWCGAVATGVWAGIALLAKFTCVLLLPAAGGVMMATAIRRGTGRAARARIAAQYAAMCAICWCVLCAGYGFEDVGVRPSGQAPHSRSLEFLLKSGEGIGRWMPPLPRNAVVGLDLQQSDFERGMPSYANGVWSPRGWWWYYLYACAVKLPLGTLLLFFIATAVWIVRAGALCDECCVMLPMAVLFGAVSAQTGLSVHSRYLLPALPFAYVHIARLGEVLQGAPGVLQRLVLLSAVGAVLSSMSVFPHSVSYFNEAAGGARNGWRHLAGSNVAWGQDLWHLKDWLEQRPWIDGAQLLSTSYINPALIGIDFRTRPACSGDRNTEAVSEGARCHGEEWIVVDVNLLAGASDWIIDSEGERRLPSGECLMAIEYARGREGEHAGYSFYVVRKPRGDPDHSHAGRAEWRAMH